VIESPTVGVVVDNDTEYLSGSSGKPVAVNVTGEPVMDPDVAVKVFDPAVVPKVQAGEDAMPEESVITVAGEPGAANDPSPLVT
jgi:hypothetical protein